MIYGSVCSGIEAATVAWHPLGWKAAFYAEIDKFPSAVLAHHYPTVPNFGDFTTINPEQHDAIDLLVGGTPCQSFSIAGLRGGLGDDRGNLALEYLRLADRARPRWLVWENVPGVLSSSGGRDFGAILGGMVELGYGIAYRVLDAQFCRVDGFWRAVPQRRRRVFVVGYLGDWRRAATVLFERASLLGNPAPGRETGQRVAPTISARPTGGGGLGTDFDCDGGLIHAPAVSPSLKARDYKGPSSDGDGDGSPLVAHALRADGFDASEDGTGRGTPLVSVAYNITPSNSNKDYNAREASYAQAVTTDGGAPSARGGDLIAFSSKDSGNDCQLNVAPTMRAMNSVEANQNAGGQLAIAQGWAVRRLTPRECERLQGFPDDYTLIPWRKGEAPDGPRYKALGNSMAVNVMRWIGTRIQMVEDLGLSVQQAAE